MNLAKLPGWPRFLRHSLAAAYVDMSSAELDRAVACGEMPDPLQTSAGERFDRNALDLALDKLAGNVGEVDWRTLA